MRVMAIIKRSNTLSCAEEPGDMNVVFPYECIKGLCGECQLNHKYSKQEGSVDYPDLVSLQNGYLM